MNECKPLDFGPDKYDIMDGGPGAGAGAGGRGRAYVACHITDTHFVPSFIYTQCRMWYGSFGIESRSTNQNCAFRNPNDRLADSPTGSRSLSE